MIDLERRIGPWSLRLWGLVVNFAGNALALYGAAGILQDGSRRPVFVVGIVMTVVCLAVLAVPSRDA